MLYSLSPLLRRSPQTRTHPVTRADMTKTVSASYSDDLFHNVSPSGSVFVGRFYYRRHTRWDCMFVVLFSLWLWCVRVCVGVCVLAPLDDILISFNFRLEATVSHSPMVKGKNKRHTCPGMCVWMNTHSSLIRAVEFYKIPGAAHIQPRLAAIQSRADWGTRILVHLVKSGQLRHSKDETDWLIAESIINREPIVLI